MKRLVKVVVASAMVLGVSGMVFSQDGPRKVSPEKKEQFEKIEAAKVVYFENELKISDKEREKFWSTYNAYKKSLKQNDQSEMKLKRELNAQLDSISDKEVKAKFDAILELQRNEIQLKKEFVSKSADIIGYSRSVKALELERKFKKQLMQRVKGEGETGKKTAHKKVPHSIHQRVTPE